MHRYAVLEPGKAVTRLEGDDPSPLGPLEVEVEVTHTGICATDLGMIDNHYGISRYPVVAGHEGVGVVTAIGAAVDPAMMPLGARVGVGAIAGSCMSCEWCLSGRANHCPRMDGPVLRGDRGTFASHVRAGDWRHAPIIPDALPSAAAAPLLCAGSTVFSPLIRYAVSPVDRVAVAGIGGLGHLALQFLAAWGCHVTAITGSPDKAADARRFGAHDVRAVADLEPDSYDFILSTAPAALPWATVTAALRPEGTLCLVGVWNGSLEVPPVPLVAGERRIVGGAAGTPVDVRRMLDFAARHGIAPQTELFPVARIDEALDRVRAGDVRYRAVLEM